MIVKKVSESILDVFCGNGWLQWSRFEVVFLKGRLTLKLIKGQPMSKEMFSTLYKELSR